MFLWLGLFRRGRSSEAVAVSGHDRTEPRFGGETETVSQTVAGEFLSSPVSERDENKTPEWPNDPDETPDWLRKPIKRRTQLGIEPLPYCNRRQYENALRRARELIEETEAGEGGNAGNPTAVSPRNRETALKDEALADLRAMLDDGVRIASQQWLSERWNRPKGTVSKWIVEWERTGAIAALRYQNGRYKGLVAKSEIVGRVSAA